MSLKSQSRAGQNFPAVDEKLFHSEALDVHERLEAFEKFVYGESTGYRGQPRLLNLSGTNDNYNRVERHAGCGVRASTTLTSGYAARAREDPLSDPQKDLFINVCVSGGGLHRSQQGTEHIFEGDISFNNSKNYQFWFSEGEYCRVVFPKNLISTIDQTQDRIHILRKSDPVTNVVRSAVLNLFEGLQSGDESQARLMSELMISISQNVLENIQAGTSRAGYDHIRDRAIEFIRDNLSRSDLTVAEVASYAHVSRATLYRAFENVGGLKEFITSERIATAKSMLRRGLTARGHVAFVAYSTGFATPEHFSKVFKAKTGMIPTKFVESGLG